MTIHVLCVMEGILTDTNFETFLAQLVPDQKEREELLKFPEKINDIFGLAAWYNQTNSDEDDGEFCNRFLQLLRKELTQENKRLFWKAWDDMITIRPKKDPTIHLLQEIPNSKLTLLSHTNRRHAAIFRKKLQAFKIDYYLSFEQSRKGPLDKMLEGLITELPPSDSIIILVGAEKKITDSRLQLPCKSRDQKLEALVTKHPDRLSAITIDSTNPEKFTGQVLSSLSLTRPVNAAAAGPASTLTDRGVTKPDRKPTAAASTTLPMVAAIPPAP